MQNENCLQWIPPHLNWTWHRLQHILYSLMKTINKIDGSISLEDASGVTDCCFMENDAWGNNAVPA